MISHASSSPPVSPRLSATGVIAIWLVTRAALLALTLGWFQGDTGTYFEQGRRWLGGERPYLDYPVEYPPGAALLFAGLVALARIFGDDLATFRIVFVLACLVCDAALAWMLARVPAADPEGRPSRGPVLAHAAIGLCLYPIWLVRFDLFPSVFVLLAALMVARPASNLRSGARAGLALGLGIALKLYPVLLFFPWLVGLARSLFPSTISHQPAASETRSRAFAAQLRFLIVVGGAAALVVVISFAPAWLAGAGPAVFSFLDY
ncbi:MAG TPA: hypothetical protein VGG33_10960, partial [Polyangia bacterium]